MDYEEISIRDGAQQINIINTYEAIDHILECIISTGIKRIEYKILNSDDDIRHFHEIYHKYTDVTFSLLTLPTDKMLGIYKELFMLCKDTSRINIKFLFPVSEQHLKYKLKMTSSSFLEKLFSFYDDLKLNCCSIILEDASSCEALYLIELCNKIKLKMNISSFIYADTKGIMTPLEVSREMTQMVQYFLDIKIGFHGHNDLACGVANAFTAVNAGCSIIEGTFLGIGERAGNVALEELEVALSYKGLTTYQLSSFLNAGRKLSEIYQINLPTNKVLLGAGYFKHTSGIHQDAETKMKGLYSPLSILGFNYEHIVTPLSSTKLILNQNCLFNIDFALFYKKINSFSQINIEQAYNIWNMMP